MASRLPDADRRRPSAGRTRDLPVPVQRASAHARVFDHAGAAGARAIAPAHVAFRVIKHVGLRVEDFSRLSGRGAGYPAPPPQIPACGFPAPGSCRRSNATDVRGLGGPSSSDPWLAASVTCRFRRCVRGMRCRSPLPSTGRLPSTLSAAAPSAGFVRGFIGTMQPSDSSDLPDRLRLLDFPSRPGTAMATAGGRRSPRFRRDPFVRDLVSDPGRATVPRITAPHMLPSAVSTASAPAILSISWLNPTPHMICCVRFAVVVTFHDATLATGRALPLTRAGLSPAGSRQLRLAHQWLAYALPCQRFAGILADAAA